MKYGHFLKQWLYLAIKMFISLSTGAQLWWSAVGFWRIYGEKWNTILRIMFFIRVTVLLLPENELFISRAGLLTRSLPCFYGHGSTEGLLHFYSQRIGMYDLCFSIAAVINIVARCCLILHNAASKGKASAEYCCHYDENYISALFVIILTTF